MYSYIRLPSPLRSDFIALAWSLGTWPKRQWIFLPRGSTKSRSLLRSFSMYISWIVLKLQIYWWPWWEENSLDQYPDSNKSYTAVIFSYPSWVGCLKIYLMTTSNLGRQDGLKRPGLIQRWSRQEYEAIILMYHIILYWALMGAKKRSCGRRSAEWLAQRRQSSGRGKSPKSQKCGETTQV